MGGFPYPNLSMLLIFFELFLIVDFIPELFSAFATVDVDVDGSPWVCMVNNYV